MTDDPDGASLASEHTARLGLFLDKVMRESKDAAVASAAAEVHALGCELFLRQWPQRLKAIASAVTDGASALAPAGASSINRALAKFYAEHHRPVPTSIAWWIAYLCVAWCCRLAFQGVRLSAAPFNVFHNPTAAAALLADETGAFAKQVALFVESCRAPLQLQTAAVAGAGDQPLSPLRSARSSTIFAVLSMSC